MHPFIDTQKEWLRNVPAFRAGDTLRVNVRVREGDKERLQAFEGVCIAKRGSGVSATFTVRKISNGIGVERIFPLHSPMIAEISVVRRGRVRRAKRYYLRHLTGKATRIRERKAKVLVPGSETIEQAAAAEAGAETGVEAERLSTAGLSTVQDEVESGPPPQSTPENQTANEKPRRRRRRKRWTTIERDLRLEKGPLLAGVDEVGRGPIAGPVVACAVIMPPDTRAIVGIDDSKRLTHDQRVRLAVKIRQRAVAYALGAASVREIDTINIYQASVLAMQRALTRLRVKPDHVVIDGRAMRTLPIPHTAVVRGDRRCFSVACASIIAKVTRDLLMTRLAQRYPHYTWDHNAGYTTRQHVSGLTAYGIT